jgi:hypothetical protein
MNVLKVMDSPPKQWGKYDLCLIIPTEASSCKIRGDSIVFIRSVARLLGRKYLYVYYSDDGYKAYVLIRAGLRLLRTKALEEKWKLLLDENECQNAAYTGSKDDFVNSFSVPHMPSVTHLKPFEYLYATYNSIESEYLFKRSKFMRHPFHKTLRIRMLFDYFEKNTSTEQELSLDKLKANGTITDMFAVHSLNDRNEIAKQMLAWHMCTIPFDLMQQYFGEEITMYFAFLGKFEFFFFF